MPSQGLLTPILLPVMALIRAQVPGALGMHQIPVTLKSWTWSGGKSGLGTVQPLPDMRVVHYDANGNPQNTHVAGTAGDIEITVDYITPAFLAPDGVTQLGFTPAQLNPPDQPGGYGRLYQVGWLDKPRLYDIAPRGVTTTRPLHYTLHLVSTDRVVPY